jgi:hypothetical protein
VAASGSGSFLIRRIDPSEEQSDASPDGYDGTDKEGGVGKQRKRTGYSIVVSDRGLPEEIEVVGNDDGTLAVAGCFERFASLSRVVDYLMTNPVKGESGAVAYPPLFSHTLATSLPLSNKPSP